jgi:predicted DNA repair protein MutK
MVRFMPRLMVILSTVGTAAMLWVGGSIVTHGLAELGWPWLYDGIHHIAEVLTHDLTTGQGFAAWLVTAVLDGLFGILLGLLLIPIATRVVGPIWAKLTGTTSAAH